MIQRVVRIENELGLHARAAAKLVKLTSRFESRILLARQNRDESIDGKSILGILLLAAGRGTQLTVTAEGVDETAALQSIVELIENKFGESR